MNILPKITIVTPSYNQGKFIEKTILSVISQNYPNLEYFVFDGGSTDETIQIIEKYSDVITYWKSEADNGQADAIMKGFRKASGEIIGWVNSDDILLPTVLHQVGEFFKDHPSEICLVGSSVVINEGGEVITHALNIPSFTVGNAVNHTKLLHYGCSFNQPSVFFRRSTFFETGGFDVSLKFCFDYDLFLRLSAVKEFAYTKTFFSAFRIHGASKTTQIQQVCRRENEVLWKRNKRNELITVFAKVYYSIENYVKKYLTLVFQYHLFQDAVESLNDRR